MTEKDNALLGLAPGSPIKKEYGFSHVPGGLSGRGSGCTSGTDSPMSVGSPVGLGKGIALTGALKARAQCLLSSKTRLKVHQMKKRRKIWMPPQKVHRMPSNRSTHLTPVADSIELT